MIRNITVNDAPIIKKKIGMNVDGRMHSEMTAFYRLFVPTAISLPLFIYVHSQNTLMERLLHFMKYYMAEADLVALLESRGLVISDEAKAVRYLESIGYYRLSPYMYPFLMFVSLSS